ncbi:MAG: hypothetical protein ABIF87_15535 [Pseudomonadota bacterium]
MKKDHNNKPTIATWRAGFHLIRKTSGNDADQTGRNHPCISRPKAEDSMPVQSTAKAPAAISAGCERNRYAVSSPPSDHIRTPFG